MFLFPRKPETNFEYLVFCFFVSFFGSLSSTAGHELVHKRESIHKFVGNLVYTLFLYSHFHSEHLQSHHKDLATPNDAVSH